jgi:DNA invertase Pin-like site-specific DNA recombinase
LHNPDINFPALLESLAFPSPYADFAWLEPIPGCVQGIAYIGPESREIRAMKRVALYLRVSTLNGQTTDNQEHALREVAARRGWQIVHVFKDEGISGAKGRDQRPGFDALMKAAARREMEIVAAWSVDRLGRSLRGLVEFLEELRSLKIDLFLHQQGLDTSTATGRAMYGLVSVFAEWERSIIRERVIAGLARVKATGQTKSGKPPGRPRISPQKEKAIIEALLHGHGVVKTSRLVGCGVSTVERVRRELEPTKEHPLK